MAIQFTPAQSTAIRYGRGNLLLSAAAGSGKTATLTGRILHLLETGEASLSEMLIVTYTRAAAAELRERIGSGILESAKKNTGRKMAENLAAVGSAEISTIHSFLYRNLRPYFASLGLSPDFSIGDEAVMESLRQEAMRDTLDDFFDQSAAEGIGAAFIALADTLSGAKDAASLDKTLLAMASRITAAGNTPAVLLTYADAMEEGAKQGFFTMPQSEPIKNRLLLLADHGKKCSRYYLNAFTETPKVLEKYGDGAEGMFDCCDALEKITAKNDYTAIREFLHDFSLPKLKSLSSNDATEASKLFKDMRERFKKEIAKLEDRYFSAPEEVLSQTLLRTAGLLRTAAVVLDRYFAAYRMKKYNRSLLDYNDLESFALSLFLDEKGNPTSAAKEVGRKYKYIFVDEYQDTNRVQDAIFRSISEHSSRFMVGDIKQSVYRFRGAEPSVFSHYRDTWETISPEAGMEGEFAPDDGRCLFMSENFRCDETVVDFVNLVSDVLFSSGGIPYTKEDALVFGKGSGGTFPAEICLIDKNGDGEEENEMDGDPEAEYVAKRILDMLGESIDGVRPVVPGDIAILLRSPDTSAGAYRTALIKRGIPVTMQNTPLLFTSPAVLLVLCLMHTADNPLSDIYTAGAMHSPLFGFTTEDMVRLQKLGGEVPLYIRVKMAVLPEEEWAFPEDTETEEEEELFAATEDETGLEADLEDAPEEADTEVLPEALMDRCRRFLSAVDTLRNAARGMRADRFLDTVYREYALYELPEIGDNPAEQGNLQALYELARRYESGTFGGIAGFLQYIEELKGKEKEKMPEETGGAVTILSIHRSKGLEYPVVFLCECAKKRNTKDEEGDVLYDADLGFGMRLPDPGGLVRCGTALRSGIMEKIRREGIEEEMRVLYVALTRARNRLIITAKTNDAEAELDKYKQQAELVTPWRIMDGSTYIDWILTAAYYRGFSPCYVIRTEEGVISDETGEAIGIDKEKMAEYGNLTDKLRQNCEFVYPYAYLSSIPAKLTVSGLYPTILDEEDTAEEAPISRMLDGRDSGERVESAMPLPRFMTGMTDTVTPADRGTATHVFLQFADLSALRENGVEAELARLTDSHYITPEMAANVYVDQIERFVESDLFRRMSSAPEIHREFRFNAAMDAARFTGNSELAEKLTADGIKLTVQGVVDCVFRDERGHLVLLDYKTDHPYREEYKNPALADERFRTCHGEQLRYYKEICEKMFGEEIPETLIYSTVLAREIPV